MITIDESNPLENMKRSASDLQFAIPITVT